MGVPIIAMASIRLVLFLLAAAVLDTGTEAQTSCTSLTADATKTGTLTSPNYPSNYANNLKLCWILKSNQDGYQVQLKILDLYLESCSSCACDYVEIRDGSTSSASLIGERHCGQKNTFEVLSTGDQIYVYFRTDGYHIYRGFKMEYQSINIACTSLTADATKKGTFTSPNHPSNYNYNERLCWVLTAQEDGYQVRLRFLSFRLSNCNDCGCASLLMRDGSSSGAPMIGKKYCSSNNVPVTTSTGDQIYVYFWTDAHTTRYSGFKIEYESVGDMTCTSLTADATKTGTFTSPNYPSNYDKYHMSCWIITSSSGVQLRFLDFQTANTDDYLEIKDGSNSNSPLIGKYSGHMDVPNVDSTGNSIYVYFRVGSITTDQGFKIDYNSMGGLACTSLTADVNKNGTFTSPNYPSNYDNYHRCWIISATRHQVQLRFLDFKTADTDDYVEIKDGSTSNSPLIGKYSGHTDVPNVQSTGDIIYVYFRADSSYTDRGFQIEYQAIGGLTCTSLTASITQTGIVTSPNYPSDYDNYHMLCWIITSVLRGQQVQLRFQDFKTGSTHDYVEIRDGSSSDSILIGKYSGDMNVPDVISTGDSVYIYFRTGSSTNERGFKMDYSIFVEHSARSNPRNTAAKVGEPAHLECSTNPCCELKDVTIWGTRQEASGLDTFIYRHTVNGIDVKAEYEGDANNSRRFADDLIIKSASEDTAGFYSCIHIAGGQKTRYSALFNAMETPQCTSTNNTFRETSGTNLECSVAYWGPMKPRLTWRLGNLEVCGKVVQDSDDYANPPAAGEQRFLKIMLEKLTMELFRDEFQITCVVSFDAKDQESTGAETGPMPTYTDSCTMVFKRKSQRTLKPTV